MDVIPTESSLLLYQTEDGQTKIEVRLQDETVWLSQAQLCELFDKDQGTICRTYTKHIYRERELLKKIQYAGNSGILPLMAKIIR